MQYNLIIADDHKMFIDGLLSILKDALEFSVTTTAKNGAQVIKYLDINGVADLHLLVTDLTMPEMDGIELAQRCNEVSPATKVMFITGFAAVTLKASREQPTAKVLSKPFHLRDLVLEVERVFEDQAQATL